MHGLGATKVSFLPTVAALAADPPGDRGRPARLRRLGQADPRRAMTRRIFARAVVALLDALEIERAAPGRQQHGRPGRDRGRPARARPGRPARAAGAVAGLAARPAVGAAAAARRPAARPDPARAAAARGGDRPPRGARRADEQWTAAGIDEFLRSYLTPRGRAAFYAAARNIYLEEPHGPDGLWTRLPELQPPSLFVWGRHDTLVPIGFAGHVREACPPPSTSSSTAATCPSWSARAGRTARC